MASSRREVWLYSKRLLDQHNPDIDYQPLGERQIRLIEFRLFHDEDRLVPRLYFRSQCKPLDNLPYYIALSYTWSTPQTKLATPKYNGFYMVQNHPVSAIYGFMRKSWDEGKKKAVFFWVDQYSINQKDLDEKDHQIRYMKEIYQRAWKTLIFIGNPPSRFYESTFRSAFKLLQDFHLAARGPEAARTSLVIPQTLSTMSALAAILTAPWFSRTWVLQEAVVSAENAVLVCGLIRVKWMEFLEQLRYFDQVGQLMELLENVCAENVYYMTFVKRIRVFIDLHLDQFAGAHWRYEPKLLMQITKPLEATHRRDKLYALLGLCSYDPGVEVKHGRGEAKIFHDLAYRFLSQPERPCHPQCPPSCPWSRLSVLADVNTDNVNIATPTWVPDWTETKLSEDIWYQAEAAGYRASGDSVCTLSFSGPKAAHSKLKIVVRICSKVKIVSTAGPQLLFTRKNTGSNRNMTWGDHMDASPDFWERTSHLTKWIREVEDIIREEARLPTRTLSRIVCAAIPPSDTYGVYAPNADDDVFERYFTGYKKYVQAWEDDGRLKQEMTEQQLARFFLTESNHMGLGPARMQPNDVVAIPLGSPMPFLLRPDGNNYQLVGYCYVDGMMGGEMMERGDNNPPRWIRLN
ncbi:hypothetical protein SLS58_008572 [Diplodia intermedia]|uniref:Heterokaryon incompatibility domain-containing protein n=1 Tax=Diplodia intermedia TaxID=856260 RepID=A0ABR3TGY1_9PEZI